MWKYNPNHMHEHQVGDQGQVVGVNRFLSSSQLLRVFARTRQRDLIQRSTYEFRGLSGEWWRFVVKYRYWRVFADRGREFHGADQVTASLVKCVAVRRPSLSITSNLIATSICWIPTLDTHLPAHHSEKDAPICTRKPVIFSTLHTTPRANFLAARAWRRQ